MSTTWPFEIQLLSVPNESHKEPVLKWIPFNTLEPVRDDDALMKIGEQCVTTMNHSREWSMGKGYHWSGREQELRAVGVRRPKNYKAVTR